MNLKEELGLDQTIETMERVCLLNIFHTVTMLYKASYIYFRQHGITDAQLNVLIQLQYEKQQDLSQADLGRRLVANRADMTGIIDRLERAGLVGREDHPKDRLVHINKIPGSAGTGQVSLNRYILPGQKTCVGNSRKKVYDDDQEGYGKDT
jgi:hypothetical protein